MSGLTLGSQQVRALLLWAELCPLATHMPSWFTCLWKMRRAPGALLSHSCLTLANLFTVLLHSWTKEVLPWQEQTKKPPFKVRSLPTGETKNVMRARTEGKRRKKREDTWLLDLTPMNILHDCFFLFFPYPNTPWCWWWNPRVFKHY